LILTAYFVDQTKKEWEFSFVSVGLKTKGIFGAHRKKTQSINPLSPYLNEKLGFSLEIDLIDSQGFLSKNRLTDHKFSGGNFSLILKLTIPTKTSSY